MLKSILTTYKNIQPCDNHAHSIWRYYGGRTCKIKKKLKDAIATKNVDFLVLITCGGGIWLRELGSLKPHHFPRLDIPWDLDSKPAIKMTISVHKRKYLLCLKSQSQNACCHGSCSRRLSKLIGTGSSTATRSCYLIVYKYPSITHIQSCLRTALGTRSMKKALKKKKIDHLILYCLKFMLTCFVLTLFQMASLLIINKYIRTHILSMTM